jgi:hypothetical protein
MGISVERARAAKAALLPSLEQLDNVTGVGITRLGDDYAVKVNLREPPGPDFHLPAVFEGVPIRVEVTGVIRPRD